MPRLKRRSSLGYRAMAAYSLVFFFCFFVLPMASADSKCKKSFDCGELGSLEFPLSESPDCGLFQVDCNSSPPSIYFDWRESLLLQQKISANKFLVRDFEFEKLLAQESCLSFFSRSPTNSTFATFEIHPFITTLSCDKKQSTVSHDALHAVFREYTSYENCSDVFVYYGTSDDKKEGNTTIPNGCCIIHLPVKSNYTISHPVFQLLSPEFELEWNVSAECLSCHESGGKCLADSNKRFQCEGAKSKHKTTVAIALGVSAAAVFLIGFSSVVSFQIYRRRRRANDAYLLSRNVSFDPTIKSDVEGRRLYFGIPIFSYKELEDATNKFDPANELGDGGFGTVYYGKLQDGREVAIKRLYEHNCRRMEHFMNEINILTCLRHPNLVSLYGCTSRRSRELLLLYEYIPNGTVADHLYGERTHEAALTWPVRMRIAMETASALAFLHSSDIIHRDVKTYNILLDNNFSVKVADFGLSRLFPNDVTHISTAPQGTPGYVDPEYHQCYQLTNKSDVYSFGVVLVELISSMPAVDTTRHRHDINLANLALDRIQRCMFEELIDLSLGYNTDAEVARMTTSVAELAFRCLQLDGEMRPSMAEVLAFLKDVQGGGPSNIDRTKEGNVNSPESDDAVLLKTNTESSPVSVTGK